MVSCPQTGGRTSILRRRHNREKAVTYSYTQIREYLTCPRRYRHRYLDGWQEKEDSAASLFGRAFEKALAAYFLRQDPVAVLLSEWHSYRGDLLRTIGNKKW